MGGVAFCCFVFVGFSSARFALDRPRKKNQQTKNPQKPTKNPLPPTIKTNKQGTCSYVLTGTEQGFRETFGSTCHGAGRATSRNAARHKLDYHQVLEGLKTKGIAIRVASPKLVMEEAPESYKDVTAVVDTCHEAGISRKAVRLRPICVVKG